MTTEPTFGSIPEKVINRELRRRGYEQDFDYRRQVPVSGGILLKGGNKIDFLFIHVPLAININGEWWHYEQGAAKIAADRLLRTRLAARNITMIFIDESHVMANARYYVSEALQFRDHSQLG